MVAVIITIVFAIVVAFFATQNTASVVITIPQHSVSVPLYLVVLLSLLVGFIFAWILHLLNAFTSLFALRDKNNTLKEKKKANLELVKRVHQLELENATLTAKEDTGVLEDNSL